MDVRNSFILRYLKDFVENAPQDLATRILAAWYLLGQDTGYPAVNFDAWNLNSAVNTHVNVQGNHASLVYSEHSSPHQLTHPS